jgi:hypothetical protein
MRLYAFAAISALALGAASCAPHVDYAARTRLDCPDIQGELTRVSVAADGKSCLYRSGEVDVNLQLTPVSGDPYSTLKGIETSLVGAQTTASAESSAGSAKAQKASDATAAHAGAAKAAQEAAADAGEHSHDADWNADDKDGDKDGDKGSVTIDKTGAHVATGGDHDHAHVNLPGLHIDADDDNANIDVAGIHINADDGRQTVRIMHDVRLRGQPFSRERRGLRATFISQQDNAGGYRFVGYEASGPKAGPLTVAIVKSNDEIDNGNRLYHDIQRLVRRNGGA